MAALREQVLDVSPRNWSNPTRQCCSQVRTWVSWQFWVNSGHGSIRNPPQKGAIWARQRTWRPRWPRNRFQNDPDAHSWMSPCQMDHMKAPWCSSQYLTKLFQQNVVKLDQNWAVLTRPLVEQVYRKYWLCLVPAANVIDGGYQGRHNTRRWASNSS